MSEETSKTSTSQFTYAEESKEESKVPAVKFTYADFDSGKVFEHLVSITVDYERDMEERRMEALAKQIGFNNFKRSYFKYQKMLKDKNKPVIIDDGLTGFGEQPIELNTGEWHADEGGIWKYGNGASNIIWACSHPIMPVMRMRSIDTRMIKYKLLYHRGSGGRKAWDEVQIEASDMFSPSEIVKKLAPYGISISGGDRAKAMVDYLRDTTDKNYDLIPEVKSVSRMGWNEEGFSPYVGGVIFDSANAFQGIYKSIAQAGTLEKWMEEALDARTYSTTARIVLASSFAAPLMEPLGVLPFFVHLWSTASGTGKTVAQMLGASVWANPALGSAFFPTFRSTAVGIEMLAGFLHSLPMFIDELQLAKDSRGTVRFNVYELASGQGKLRSNKQLGLNYMPSWNMCFITSGETPIVGETDGEGALNRVIEIECYADDKAISDGHRTANTLKANYGHAGKLFIERLIDGMDRTNLIDAIKEKVMPVYDEYFKACIENDTTEKQAMAAATILTGDHFATELIFKDGRNLTVDDIGEFLKTKERVSLMERGYDTICDWVSINANKLRGIREDDKGECYGLVEGNTAYIIRSVFNRVCMENAIDPKGLLSHLRTRGLIETGNRGFTKTKAIGQGNFPNCVWLKLPGENGEIDQYGELPF